MEALFEIRHLGRVAHGSRQAFQLGAEDFAGDEVHIRFLSAGWRGCLGRLGGRSRLAAGSMGEAGRLFAVFPGGGVSVSPPLHSFHTEGFLAGRLPTSQTSWEVEGARGRGAAAPRFNGLGWGLAPGVGGTRSYSGWPPPPVSIMFFYALAAAQISRAFSAAEEASGV